MKKRTFLFVVLVMAIKGLNLNAQAPDTSNRRMLVAYFSRSGNTEVVADHIKHLVGVDMFKIEMATPYPDDYKLCTEQANEDKRNNARPALKSNVDRMDDYDVVFVGFPNWWGTMPMPVLTFLESYDLKGKVVVPFCTHGGAGEQSCFKDFVKATEGSEHRKGFLVNGGQVATSKENIEQWLRDIKIVK